MKSLICFLAVVSLLGVNPAKSQTQELAYRAPVPVLRTYRKKKQKVEVKSKMGLGSIELEVFLPAGDFVEANLYDQSGELSVAMYEGALIGDWNTLEFPINLLEGGVFILELKHSTGKIREKVLLIP
ncbi:hypothetical protein [Pontibacter sp. G13]|uniref:hypothetical protein n=1 Tax=Pontibacter sp. G13 TaxID=3074898 RepID=UPI00288C201C|nr:hypothetical protein [Pontibacter sp. G13]WNJ18954.1 hypothetical protein RJD25_00565 [Pontibacter sp. G13]